MWPLQLFLTQKTQFLLKNEAKNQAQVKNSAKIVEDFGFFHDFLLEEYFLIDDV